MEVGDPLKILILAAEIVPFVKVGGLADVVGALPKSLKALGHDIRLAMPRYGQVDPTRFQLENSARYCFSEYEQFSSNSRCTARHRWRGHTCLYD